MSKRILLIQGHPDDSQPHLCHALEIAYGRGAESVGHEIKRINVAALDFPLLRSEQKWQNGKLPSTL
ncbi:MAG: NAD(P)H-dependent oxidoreductase, partial [Undibacterium sp.]|nr:NAD(P)H-dependent oxidoreductase [Undibacterium sp.]